jgi:predicted NAD-dependent protein-ADP-ribosyltransferase YbiA (DUF1768 family)/DNA-directed RNA polymerase subunit M/transcription elongation factor TFIIS
LSNFAPTPFEWKDHQWNSAEHAYHAAKFETLNPDVFYSFTLDSGSELGQGDGSLAQKQRKAVKFTKAQQADWDAKKAGLLTEIWRAKFTQNEEAKRVLLLTGKAELWHVIPRSATKEHWTALEEIRAELVLEDETPREAQTNAPKQETEMEAATTAKPKTRGRKKVVAPNQQSFEVNATAVTGTAGLPPASVLASAVAADEEAEQILRSGIQEGEPKKSSIRLCPECNYYLYLVMDNVEQNTLVRKCRNCGYNEVDTQGGLVMEMIVQEKSSESYKIQLNEFTHRDPCLPHLRKDISCPNPACGSNQGKQEPDVIYMKYDPVNMLYIYICNVDGCGTTWRSGRH